MIAMTPTVFSRVILASAFLRVPSVGKIATKGAPPHE